MAYYYECIASTYYEDNDGNSEAAESKNESESARYSALIAAQEQKNIARSTASAFPLAKSKAISYAKSEISKYSKLSEKAKTKKVYFSNAYKYERAKEEFQNMKGNFKRLEQYTKN